MYSRQWLEEELAKNLPWEKHCWESLFTRHSCMGHMTTAQELFNQSKDRKSLDLWALTIKRAEVYVNTKDPHRPYGLFGIEDKTTERKQYIDEQRLLVKRGEELLKDKAWKALLITIGNNKADYDRTQQKAELTVWKASLTQANQFLKENKREKAELQPYLDTYQLAEKEYNKDNSCISRCFFWCYATDDAVADSRATANSQNQHHYAKLNG